MHVTSQTAAGGVIEQLFTLGDIRGVLWTSAEPAGPRPLILLAHGGAIPAFERAASELFLRRHLLVP